MPPATHVPSSRRQAVPVLGRHSVAGSPDSANSPKLKHQGCQSYFQSTSSKVNRSCTTRQPLARCDKSQTHPKMLPRPGPLAPLAPLASRSKGKSVSEASSELCLEIVPEEKCGRCKETFPTCDRHCLYSSFLNEKWMFNINLLVQLGLKSLCL